MAVIRFFEKPGCRNNIRQKRWLEASGHIVLARNLLTERWSEARLRPCLHGLPIPEWFNRAAPKVKSGEVVPENLSADQALEWLIAEPLLIRRPLMEAEGRCRVGFDPKAVERWIGLDLNADPGSGDIEACAHPHADKGHGCAVKESS